MQEPSGCREASSGRLEGLAREKGRAQGGQRKRQESLQEKRAQQEAEKEGQGEGPQSWRQKEVEGEVQVAIGEQEGEAVKFLGQQLLQHLWLSQPLAQPADLRVAHPYFQVVVGADDFWKGYRQNHVTQAHEAVNIITLAHPTSKSRVYAQLYGMPFGLASAVNQFNRAPSC